MAYLTQSEWKDRTVMPSTDVDALEARYPGWLTLQLDEESDAIDSRLRKRYDAPFSAPYPKAILRWLTKIVTRSAYLKRGVDPNDAQIEEVFTDAADVWVQIKEAADSVDGLFDLPLRSNTSASAITKGGPLGYSEASPFVSTDRQRDTGRDEDAAGTGTGDGA